MPTGQGKVREICFFFKVREQSGNSVKWSGKLENLLKSGNFKITIYYTHVFLIKTHISDVKLIHLMDIV